ncbi:MAG: ABC transporter permease [Anaerolineae bacterium]|nr:ABC transporter permease [Anaerolineae bacterium]
MTEQPKSVVPTAAVAKLTAPQDGASKASRLRPPGWLSIILGNRKAVIGLLILLFFILVALFAPMLTNTVNPTRLVARRHLPPNETYIVGTTGTGQDVFAQLVYGARTTLVVGFLTGASIIILSILIGLTAGYVGGRVDDFLSLFMNVFLILPGLPLIIVVAGWLDRPGPFTIVLVLSFTGWAYNARVFRAQTLALRNSEFVAAAKVAGEPSWRIILYEILPNMTSLVVSAFVGTVIYAIITEAGLEYIGLGDANAVTWGTILYWAQQNQALLVGAWWTFIPAGVCIALIGLALTLINYAIDEITNPRLRGEGA